MESKKIFFVADARSIHTVKWVDYFVDKGYEVSLATFASQNNTKCKNIYYLGNKRVKVGGGNYFYLFSVKKLAKIFKETQADIINAHYSYSMGLVALVAKKLAKIDAKLSVVCHGSDILNPPKPFIFDLINRYVLKHSDKVFAVSDQIKDKLLSMDIDTDKIFVGQYGIALSDAMVRYKKDIDILSNRNYTPNSRIEFLLSGLEDYKNEGLNIVFVVPHIDNKRLEELKSSYPFVKFYQQVSYEAMVDMVRRTKVYISATQSDGTSLSLLEAMESGAVPVVSNIVSNRSWIVDGMNGYLFDTQEEFVAKTRKALYEKNDNIIDLNKNLIRNKANYELQMRKIEDYLIK